jgi:hypothetical protein
MKHLESFIYLLIIILLLQFCKSSDPAPTTAVGTPEITEKGIPFGTATSATIGSAGGIVTSADGLVTLDIPVGALDANTTISIQPITNTAPLGVSGFSYRFSPDGQTFKKPAKLTFNYTPDLLDNTSAQLLWIVTQAKDGSWKALLKSSVDDNAQIVSGQIYHFSDWAIGRFMDLSLNPQKGSLNVDESLTLTVSGFSAVPTQSTTQTNDGEDDLAPLYVLVNSANRSFSPLVRLEQGISTFKNSKWKLAGEGTLTPSTTNDFVATYKAPSQVPTSRNPVAISLEMDRLVGGNGPTPPSTFSKVTLVSNILISDDGILVINFKGTQYKFKQELLQTPGGAGLSIIDELILTGYTSTGVFVIGRSLLSKGISTSDCSAGVGGIVDDATYIGAETSNVPGYSRYWCEPVDRQPPVPCIEHCANFTTSITQFGKKGEYIVGTFEGSIYYTIGDNGTLYPISGYFNMKNFY